MDLFSQNNAERAIYLEYDGDKNGDNVPNPEEIGIKYLKGDGDFRSKECIELLKQKEFFYIADNANGFMKVLYTRFLIKNKKI